MHGILVGSADIITNPRPLLRSFPLSLPYAVAKERVGRKKVLAVVPARSPTGSSSVRKRILDMCLGIPMQIQEIDGFIAHCEAKGVTRDVNLFMLQHEELEPEDFVVVHVGYAIQKITPQEAQSVWEIYDEMLSAESGGP